MDVMRVTVLAVAASVLMVSPAPAEDAGGGWMGVRLQTFYETTAQALGLPKVKGAIVSWVHPGSPAAQAGVTPGDVIVALDDQPVEGARDLIERIGSHPPGRAVTLGVQRMGAQQTHTVTLGESPKEPRPPVRSVDLKTKLEEHLFGRVLVAISGQPVSGSRGDIAGQKIWGILGGVASDHLELFTTSDKVTYTVLVPWHAVVYVRPEPEIHWLQSGVIRVCWNREKGVGCDDEKR
jgi:membrane-associated protease RseP (regulator of RpoE activity)